MFLRILSQPRYPSFLLAATVLASSGCVVVAPDIDTDSATGGTTTTSTTGGANTEPTGGQTSSTSTVGDTGTDETGAPTGTDSTAEGTTSQTSEATTGIATTGIATTGTTAEGTTDVGTTAGSTTTGGNSDLDASCDAACTLFLECQPNAYPDKATCQTECFDASSVSPACEEVATVFNNCIGGFNCKQLADAENNNEFGACTEAFNAYIQKCAG